MADPLAPSVASHIAGRIARAQELLRRVGARDQYEPRYAGERLTEAASCCLHALALLGESRDETIALVGRGWACGRGQREAIRRHLLKLDEAADGLRCVRCLEDDGPMRPAGTVASEPSRQVREHRTCAADGLPTAIEIDTAQALR